MIDQIPCREHVGSGHMLQFSCRCPQKWMAKSHLMVSACHICSAPVMDITILAWVKILTPPKSVVSLVRSGPSVLDSMILLHTRNLARNSAVSTFSFASSWRNAERSTSKDCGTQTVHGSIIRRAPRNNTKKKYVQYNKLPSLGCTPCALSRTQVRNR